MRENDDRGTTSWKPYNRKYDLYAELTTTRGHIFQMLKAMITFNIPQRLKCHHRECNPDNFCKF